MRKHVTMTLLDTEQSYVESLRTLMQVRPWPRPESKQQQTGGTAPMHRDCGRHL